MNTLSSLIPSKPPLRPPSTPLSVIHMSKTTRLISIAPLLTLLGRYGNSISSTYECQRPPTSPSSASIIPSAMGSPSCRSYMPALSVPPTPSPFHPFLKQRQRPAAVAAGFGPLVLLCWIWTCLIYTWNTLVDVFFFASTAFFLKDAKTPFMEKEGVECRPKRIVHRTLFLDDIIAIKNSIGCTINDVLVGVMSTALSRYLSRCYECLLPKHLRIRTCMAVNIRPIPGIHNLADMMKEDSGVKWGNRIGIFLLQLPVMDVDVGEYFRSSCFSHRVSPRELRGIEV